MARSRAKVRQPGSARARSSRAGADRSPTVTDNRLVDVLDAVAPGVLGDAVLSDTALGAAVGARTVGSITQQGTTVRVLLLNATHEPLAVVTGRRALVLLLAGKAVSVVDRNSGGEVRSPTVVLAVPAVLRLNRYVRVPYQPATAITRAGVLRRDRRCCAYCDGRADTIDHVQPRSRGGAHSWENCVASCARCNSRKADRLLSELGWTLAFEPGPPARAGGGRVWLTDDTDPAWDPWLLGAA